MNALMTYGYSQVLPMPLLLAGVLTNMRAIAVYDYLPALIGVLTMRLSSVLATSAAASAVVSPALS